MHRFVQFLYLVVVSFVFMVISEPYHKDAWAQTIARNFDWDNNIATLDTKIVIFNNKTGETMEVTTAQLALIRGDLGKPGAYEDFEFRIDRVNPKAGSFRNYSDGENGENLFIQQIQDTLKTQSASQWQGPMWKAFVNALSNTKTAKEVTIITARGHDPQSILDGLRYLQELGYFKYLPEVGNIFPVSNPIIGGTASDPSAVKAKVMLDLLDRTNAAASADSVSKGLTQLWEYSDDDPKNITAALNALQPEVKKGRWEHVKIMLTFTGEPSRLDGTSLPAPVSLPQTYILQSDGTPRLAQSSESDELFILDRTSRHSVKQDIFITYNECKSIFLSTW